MGIGGAGRAVFEKARNHIRRSCPSILKPSCKVTPGAGNVGGDQAYIFDVFYNGAASDIVEDIGRIGHRCLCCVGDFARQLFEDAYQIV